MVREALAGAIGVGQVGKERSFNAREGSRREDDHLPWRMMNVPVPEGPNQGMVTDREMLDRLLDQYYELHGWDPETGIPRRKTLEELGLLELCSDVAQLSVGIVGSAD